MANQEFTTLQLENEMWKVSPSWPCYEISNLGRVRRCLPGKTRKAGAILKPDLAGTRSPRYYQLELHCNGKKGRQKIHALVAEAFIGPRPTGFQVNHIDANPLNNQPENLEYVTPKGNVQHAAKLGRMYRGSAVNTSKLREEQVREIRALFARGVGGPTIAKRFGIRHQVAYLIRDRKIWKHLDCGVCEEFL